MTCPPPPASAGVVYLFGKVQSEGAWRSCCCVVEGCHYSLMVVPTPGTFADPDGEIARLEEQAAQDPETRGQLLQHLHVSGAVPGAAYSNCSMALRMASVQARDTAWWCWCAAPVLCPQRSHFLSPAALEPH